MRKRRMEMGGEKKGKKWIEERKDIKETKKVARSNKYL